MPRPQRTVRGVGEVAGIGLHSGVETTLRVKPAPAGPGVVFVRTDLPGAARVCGRTRTTSACAGAGPRWSEPARPRSTPSSTSSPAATPCGIDNLLVEIDGPECPGMDGSGRAFADLLDDARPVEQDALREEIVLDGRHRDDRRRGDRPRSWPCPAGRA